MNHTTGNEGFDRFWEAYPPRRKTGKGLALKSWQKIEPSSTLCEEIIASVHDHKRSTKWLEKNGEYIPLPATFLNQQRWQDTVEFEKPAAEYSPIIRRRKEYAIKEGVHPEAHQCHANVAKMRAAYERKKSTRDEMPGMSWTRGLLAAASWYEALHVQCKGEIHPVCPKCGASQQTFENPLIRYYMERYPRECVGWSSLHKGFLLCEECAKD